MQLEAIILSKFMQELKSKHCGWIPLKSGSPTLSTHGHRDENNRHWTTKVGRKEGGGGLKTYLLGMMFTIWLMGSIEAQTLALHNILM